ncbi:MAG TPA: hypothetical protein PLZ36_09925 [Armatimonadota bacterium]|nr:hypothetical protein [Armatimonadota bacterium]HOS44431.1 hypothetical protein [Armatimonadota bacterium]
MRELLIFALALLWVAAQASSTIYQLRMTTRPAPPPAPLPPVSAVLPSAGPLVLYDDAGAYPYYGYHDLVVSAPGYVPVLIRPTAPPVVRLRWNPHGPGVIMERDPHFYRYYSPRGPNFRTNGMPVYAMPNESAVYLFEFERPRRR